MNTRLFCGLLALYLPLSEIARADTIVIYVDCSGSMAGTKAKAATEGAKLAIAMAPSSTISIVAFNEVAVAGTFSIPPDREAALKWVQSFRIDGSTNYTAALKAADLPAGAVGIFISDGEPNTGGGSSEILDYLKTHTKGTLHTISVGCPAGSTAEGLLMQMAAIKGGSFTRVEDGAESLVRTMVRLVGNAGHYRAYRPDQESIAFRATGRILAFAYDGRPTISAVPAASAPLCIHHADLPGEKVDLSVNDFPQPAEVTLALADKRGPRARLGDIHRADLPKAELTVDTKDGRVAAGDHLQATLRFSTPAGKPIAPNRNLSAQVELLDPASTVVDRAMATPGATGTDYRAALQMPDQPGAFTVRAKTTVTTPERT